MYVNCGLKSSNSKLFHQNFDNFSAVKKIMSYF